METAYDELAKEPPEPLAYWDWNDVIDVEIWPSSRGFEVTVTCRVRRARWWQWWRSDLPFPRKAIFDALKDAQTWLRGKDAVVPSYLELKVTFAKSD